MKQNHTKIFAGGMLLFLTLILLGCAKQNVPTACFYAQGYLKDECVAEVDGARYAFLPREGEQARLYLYELDENGEKKRIVCNRKDCLHEKQSTLIDPCYAYSVCTQGLTTDGKALYAQSKNGDIGVMRFDIYGGEPKNVLRQDGQITCFLVNDGMIYWALRTKSDQYVLYRRNIEKAEAQAECVLPEEDGGYYAEIREQNGTLYLTEGKTAEDRMRLLCIGADKKSEMILENICAHTFVFMKNGFAVAKVDEEGNRLAVLLSEEGQTVTEVSLGQNPCMMLSCGEKIYVDSGFGLSEETRMLYALNEDGKELGKIAVPDDYGYMLGADHDGVYYWETAEQLKLVRIEPK